MCELSSINNPPVTEEKRREVYQPEELHRKFLEVISGAQERIDCCLDQRGSSFLVSDESTWKVIIGLLNKGKRLRFITKITQENISYCNMLMKYTTEVFHDDGIKGNFLIVDGTKYGFYIVESQEPGVREGKEEGQSQNAAITQVIYNENKPFVDSQQFLFDNVCTNATHAKEKIRQIGLGIRGDFINTLIKASEIQKTAINLFESATYEVLVLFSTINSFYRAEHSGTLNSLWQASERGIIVKVLIQADDDDNTHQLMEAIQKRIRQKHLPIKIQYFTKLLQNKITTLVIDQAVSLTIEVNDDLNKAFDESTAAAVAIYSNNESTVSSCISIFETLWIESEFEKQKKVKQAYFQMFKGFELKDEIYHSHSHKSFSEKIANKEQKEEE